MKQKKYYLHICGAKDKHAGSKAVDDCQRILKDNGYKPIVIHKERSKDDFIKKMCRYYRYLKLLFIRPNSTLIIQHPMPMPSYYLKILSYIKTKHKIRLVFLIHDLDSLRKIRKDDVELVEKRDSLMYQNADIIIAHNSQMKHYLTEKCGIDEQKIITLGIFDYLIDSSLQNQPLKQDEVDDKKNQVIIAGNLSKEKSAYIYKLISQESNNITFNLYGVFFDNSANNRCATYKGSFDPEELPDIMEGKYGLVWDGTETYSCVGTVGEYLKYNNPHKVSLYIAAEVPIIIWEKAALADFVKKNNIGLTIGSLDNLYEVLSKVTDEEYNSFKKNLKILSSTVRKGQYLKEAIKKID